MTVQEHQLELPGIGQQKITLTQWKKQNQIFTHHSPHLVEHSNWTWTCWNELENPEEFLSRYGDKAMSFASNEKDAVLCQCAKIGIDKPFWW